LRADVSLGPDNRSRGYGTVLLATAEDAGRAVDTFNGYSWQSRILQVRLDRQLQDFDSPAPPVSSNYLSVKDDQLPSTPIDPNSCTSLSVGNVSPLTFLAFHLSHPFFIASFSLPMAGFKGFISTSRYHHTCRCHPWS
jgi:hypothetical protein